MILVNNIAFPMHTRHNKHNQKSYYVNHSITPMIKRKIMIMLMINHYLYLIELLSLCLSQRQPQTIKGRGERALSHCILSLWQREKRKIHIVPPAPRRFARANIIQPQISHLFRAVLYFYHIPSMLSYPNIKLCLKRIIEPYTIYGW